MRTFFYAVPAVLIAGAALAQSAERLGPLDSKAPAPPVVYRSAFETYRPYAEQEIGDWRKANQEVGEAGGHAGHKPGQGAGTATSKPQPGSPESSGRDGAHEGHKR